MHQRREKSFSPGQPAVIALDALLDTMSSCVLCFANETSRETTNDELYNERVLKVSTKMRSAALREPRFDWCQRDASVSLSVSSFVDNYLVKCSVQYVQYEYASCKIVYCILLCKMVYNVDCTLLKELYIKRCYVSLKIDSNTWTFFKSNYWIISW